MQDKNDSQAQSDVALAKAKVLNEASQSSWSPFRIILIALLVAICLMLAWIIFSILRPAPAPVELTPLEENRLTEKLETLNLDGLKVSANSSPEQPAETLQPLPYSEKGASREVTFNERELNALIANNTELGDKIAIDLSDNLISARIVYPVEEGAPLFGGKTVKLNAGFSFSFANGEPVVVLKGVSAWGVPVPNAWMADLKGKDLVQLYKGESGFWQDFAQGIDALTISEGELFVRLKE